MAVKFKVYGSEARWSAPDPSGKGRVMTKNLWRVVAVGGGVVAFGLLVFAINAMSGGDALPIQGVVALIVGAVLTSALGVALMALVFYSSRSRRDEDVQHLQRIDVRRQG